LTIDGRPVDGAPAALPELWVATGTGRRMLDSSYGVKPFIGDEMPLPSWPVANLHILQDGFDLKRMRDPLATDMEGGNTRQRSRRGRQCRHDADGYDDFVT
jgi:hypothetical protein